MDYISPVPLHLGHGSCPMLKQVRHRVAPLPWHVGQSLSEVYVPKGAPLYPPWSPHSSVVVEIVPLPWQVLQRTVPDPWHVKQTAPPLP